MVVAMAWPKARGDSHAAVAAYGSYYDWSRALCPNWQVVFRWYASHAAPTL